jgi:hypothetical protein
VTVFGVSAERLYSVIYSRDHDAPQEKHRLAVPSPWLGELLQCAPWALYAVLPAALVNLIPGSSPSCHGSQ